MTYHVDTYSERDFSQRKADKRADRERLLKEDHRVWQWILEDKTVVQLTAQSYDGFTVHAVNEASDGDPFTVDGTRGGVTTGTAVGFYVHNSPRAREMLRAVVKIMEERPDNLPEEAPK